MSGMRTYLEMIGELLIEKGLYISIHHKLTNSEGQIFFPGSAFNNVSKAMNEAIYWSGRGHDLYLSMGGQVKVIEVDKPFKRFKAIRKRHNIGLSDCIYMDIDVKEGQYATTNEALNAVKQFIRHYSLPLPSLMVASGTGGIHIYFVADELFTPDDFNIMSTSLVGMAQEFGLKFDPQCTSDICRLLRVPGTWNFKKEPASPVKLLYSGSKILLVNLKGKLKFNGNNVLPLPRTNEININDELIHPKREYDLVDMNIAAAFCPFLHDTLISGGKDHSEPIWKQSLTLASYCENGHKLAHQLSSGHPAYSKEETDNKLNQIELDKKHNPRLGPPHCATLHKMGVEECKTCQYLNLNTTPLNIANFVTPPTVIPSHNRNSDLPENYYRGKDNTIWRDITNKDTQLGEAIHIFPYTIKYNSAFAEGGEKEYNIVFNTFEGNGKEKIIKLPMSSSCDRTSLSAALSKVGLPVIATEPMRHFMIEFMKQLRSNDLTLIYTDPIGWCNLNNKTGFSYNGICYFPNNITAKAQRLDGDLARHYSVQGSEQPWRQLSDLIIEQQRPEINAIIASGFGAPLMGLIGHSGCAFGAWSNRSGVGKSTALALSQAIWGSTIRMSGLNDTMNQAIDTLATLKNICLNWDEIKGETQIKQFVQIAFTLSQGREKGRLDRNAKQKQQREFDSLLVWTSNQPLFDEVARQLKGTAAGNYRMLEFNVDETFNSNLSITLVTTLCGELRHNHGHIGARYAKFLGENHDSIKKIILKEREKFEDEVKGTQAERYYISLLTCVYLGARFGNGLRITKFDVDKLREFLINIIIKNRGVFSRSSHDLAVESNVDEMLSELMNSYSLQMIKTDTIARGAGRPTKGAVKVLNDNGNLSRQAIVMQIARDSLTLRVSDPAIGKWCKDHGLAKSAFLGAVEKYYNAKATRSRIGSGTDYVSPPILVWEIPLMNTVLGGEFEF